MSIERDIIDSLEQAKRSAEQTVDVDDEHLVRVTIRRKGCKRCVVRVKSSEDAIIVIDTTEA